MMLFQVLALSSLCLLALFSPVVHSTPAGFWLSARPSLQVYTLAPPIATLSTTTFVKPQSITLAPPIAPLSIQTTTTSAPPTCTQSQLINGDFDLSSGYGWNVDKGVDRGYDIGYSFNVGNEGPKYFEATFDSPTGGHICPTVTR
jgi:hypothetical protein